jgi:hypothetical protein
MPIAHQSTSQGSNRLNQIQALHNIDKIMYKAQCGREITLKRNYIFDEVLNGTALVQ